MGKEKQMSDRDNYLRLLDLPLTSKYGVECPHNEMCSITSFDSRRIMAPCAYDSVNVLHNLTCSLRSHLTLLIIPRRVPAIFVKNLFS